jgi:hypothetical protein
VLNLRESYTHIPSVPSYSVLLEELTMIGADTEMDLHEIKVEDEEERPPRPGRFLFDARDDELRFAARRGSGADFAAAVAAEAAAAVLFSEARAERRDGRRAVVARAVGVERVVA